MKYYFNLSLSKAKHRIRSSLLAAIALAFPIAIGLAGVASAAPPAFGLQPFEFVGTAAQCGGPAGTDTVTAKWDGSTGAPQPSIFLQKLGATSNCAAAGVDIISSLEGQPVGNVTELNFEYKNGGHCGGGAPRFNLELNGSSNAFLGCNNVVGTPSTTPGWTHVEFTAAQIQAAVVAAGGSPTDTLTDLYIIFDEGTDTPTPGAGTVNIDNISVNGAVVGSPTSPSSGDQCKKDGYKDFLNGNGQPFKNQGECVSAASHNNGHGKDDVKLNN